MFSTRLNLFILLLSSFLFVEGKANHVDIESRVALAMEGAQLEDLTIDSIWKDLEGEVFNFGTNYDAKWLKVEVKNNSRFEELIVAINNARIPELEVFQLRGGTLVRTHLLGMNYGKTSTAYTNQNFLIDLNLKRDASKTLFLRLSGEGPLIVPINVGTVRDILEENALEDIFMGIFFGIVMSMFVYNLFIYITIREKVYLFYILYLLMIGVTPLVLKGYLFRFFTVTNAWFANSVMFYVGILSAVFGIEFLREFMSLKHNSKWLNKALYVAEALFVVIVVITFFQKYSLAHELMNVGVGVTCLLIFMSALSLAYKGIRSARFFSIAWSIVLVSTIVFVLKDLSIVPYNFFTVHSLEIGACGESMLLSLALADRLKTLKREKNKVILDSLQSQLNPHFIFNSLNTITGLLSIESKTTLKKYILNFSSLLRKILESSREDFIPVEHELELIQNYIELQKIRFDKSIKVKIEKVEGMQDVLIPPMMIQPIVENAFKHGLWPLADRDPCLELTLSYTKAGSVLVAVKDNGIGREKTSSKSKNLTVKHKSLSLQIIKERLVHLRGAQGENSIETIDLYSDSESVGTLVNLYLPYKKEQI